MSDPSGNGIVNGRYRITRSLGEGGMGSVFLASDLAQDGRPVALKRVSHPALDEQTIASFKDEFGTMTRLRHPNVVEVLDFGVDQATGEPFLTMEYLEGKDFGDYLKENGRLPASAVMNLLVQMCRGLEYIHSRGHFHNDLKAQNVRISAGTPPVCRLMDFGLASERRATRHSPRGTLHYLAPELLHGGIGPSRRSDLYALGVIFYLAFAGRLPFDGEPNDVLRQIQSDPPEPPSRFNPDLSPRIESLILRMLSKDPEARPADAAAVIAEISAASGTAYEIETQATLASYIRSGSFVGRHHEVGRLIGIIEASHRDAPGSTPARLVLLSGESGVGKSRLIGQLRYEAQLRGGSFALGQCYEDSASAFHPFAQILRQVVPQVSEDETLAPLLSGAADALPLSAIGQVDREREHRRIVDAAAQAILAAAAARPLALCVEDIQWADTASLDLIEHLARNTACTPRLVLAVTYRTEEADSGPLAGALVRLQRAADWNRIELTRLRRDDVAAMLAGMFGLEDSPAALVELLMRETEGNPLFVQMAVESLVEERGTARGGADLLTDLEGLGEISFPRSVAEAIERRLSRLDPSEAAVLEALAVAERPVDDDLLHRVLQSDGGDDRVSAAIEGLLCRRLVAREIDSAGALGTRIDHVRIRHHVHEAMDWGRRRELHGRFGLALEQRLESQAAGVSVEELAHHFINSPDVERALAYAERAGSRAIRLCANERAISFFERALELVPPSDSTRRLRLQLHLGDAYRQARDRVRATETYERLMKGARAAGDKEMAWTGTSRLLDVQWRGGQHDEAQRTAQRLVTALKAEGEKHNRASCILVLANIAGARGRLDEAKALNKEALALWREIGHMPGVAASLNNLGSIDTLQGGTDEGRTLLEESLRIWQKLPDLQRTWEVLGNLGSWYRKRGDLASAASRSEEAADLAKRHRDRFQAAQCQANLATVYHMQGRMDRALQAASDGVANAQALGLDPLLCELLDFLGMIERDLGHHAEAAAAHGRAASVAQRAGLANQEAYALSSLALDRLSSPDTTDREPKALKEILRKATKLASGVDSPRLRARLHEAAARAARAVEENEPALQSARQALEAATEGRLCEVQAAAELLIAECLVALARHQEAAEAAHRALALAEPAGLAEIRWQAHLILAGIQQQAGHRQAERDELGCAATVLREVADSIADGQIRLTYLAEPRRAEAMRKAAAAAPRPARAATLGPEATADLTLSALYEITGIISSMSDPESLLDRVLDVALGIVKAERGLVILLDETTGDQQVAAAREVEEETVRDALEYSHSVVKEAAAGHIMVALDTLHDDRFRNFKSVSLYSIKSLMCVPMKVRDRIIGTVYVDSRRRGTSFDERDLRFLTAFADLAGGAVEQARMHERLAMENVYLRREAGERNRYQNIIGKNVKMQAVYDLLEKVAASNLPVLIHGESGTGKELVARALHYSGPRRHKRFLTENVAAIPDALMESEMFGHVRGAFTGADRDHRGLFEQADGGTMFLDEVADMSLPMQSKLLRALQEGEIRPVGGKDTRKVDVRIVTATNKDLEKMMKEGRFREDLYYRINVVRIPLPPLRERKEDIPLLVEHFLSKPARETGGTVKRMEVGALQLLLRYSWPGNIRELENEMQRLAVLSSGDIITQRDIMESGELFEKITRLEDREAFASLEVLERRQIEKALMEAAGNRGRAAELLGISRATIFRKLRKLGISH